MKSIIPYTKTISFGSKIAEITSMSLEYELEKSPEEISGNFIISGEYRSHEVSVNREPFLHKLPFSIEITDRIDLDSLEFEITDFSYDVVNDDTVEVDIEFSLKAEELEEETSVEPETTETEAEEPTLEEEEPRGLFEKVEDPVSNIFDFVEEQNIAESEENVELPKLKEETNERETLTKEETLQETEDTIIDHVNPMDDNYATYHIHIVNSGESVETICTMYHSNMNLLSDYNDLKEIHVGDKIIIPKEDE